MYNTWDNGLFLFIFVLYVCNLYNYFIITHVCVIEILFRIGSDVIWGCFFHSMLLNR